jgi:hypothetical protein
MKKLLKLLFCRESTEDNYVPDVFFMEKDKYGNEIKKVTDVIICKYFNNNWKKSANPTFGWYHALFASRGFLRCRKHNPFFTVSQL